MPEDAVLLRLNIPYQSIFMEDDPDNLIEHWMSSECW